MAFSEFRYRPLPTAVKIHEDPRELIGIVGPWGSGKSTIAAVDLYMHCLKYQCDALVVRDTYPALRDSCLKKFMDQFGDAGELNWGPPPTFKWKGQLRGKEVMFRSAESPEDIQKFGSVEVGYAWLEEVCPGLLPGGNLNLGVSAEVLSGVIGRVRKWDVLPGKRRIIITSLPPPTTRHWFYTLFYDQRPLLHALREGGLKELAEQIALYRLTPEENKKNLPPNYYELQTAFLTSEDQIKRFILGEVGSGYGIAGVYAEQWNDLYHIGPNTMQPRPGPLIIGVDGGLDASAVVMQQQPDGQIQVYSELVTKGLGLEDFAQAVIQHVNRLYGPRMLSVYADPAIFSRSQNDAMDGATYMRKGGLTPMPAPQNPDVRISSVRQWLTRMGKNGPMLQVHPRCELLIEGFRGAYRFKLAGAEVLVGKVDKNEFSHVHDALQYPLAALLYRNREQQKMPPLPVQKIDHLGQFPRQPASRLRQIAKRANIPRAPEWLKRSF